MIALDVLGSQRKLSVPDVLRFHIWRTSGPFCKGSSKIVRRRRRRRRIETHVPPDNEATL